MFGIASGVYSDITVTGVCNVQDGAVITVTGSITVRTGAVLDAQSAPSTITVHHNVTALSGTLLGLGGNGRAPTQFRGITAPITAPIQEQVADE